MFQNKSLFIGPQVKATKHFRTALGPLALVIWSRSIQAGFGSQAVGTCLGSLAKDLLAPLEGGPPTLHLVGAMLSADSSGCCAALFKTPSSAWRRDGERYSMRVLQGNHELYNFPRKDMEKGIVLPQLSEPYRTALA